DRVVLLPQGQEGEIRGIEVYRRPSERVVAGQCAALNVRQWDIGGIGRGDVVTVAGYFAPQRWYACRIELLPHERLTLKTGQRVKFHTGTSEVIAAIYLMAGDRMHAGQAGLCQVRLDGPVVAGPGDRFIVRSLSPVRTIGGGIIVEAIPRRLKRTRPDVVEELAERADAVAGERNFLEHCVRKAEELAAEEAALAVRAKIPRNRIGALLQELSAEGKIVALDSGRCVHASTLQECRQRLLECTADHHRRRPRSPGPSPEQLRREAELPADLFGVLVAGLAERGELDLRDGRLALPDHTVAFDEEEQRCLEKVEHVFAEAAFRPPRPAEVARQLQAPPETIRWAVEMLTEHGRLVAVAEDLLFHRDAVERARERLVSYLREEGRLESVKFKYLLDTTRKYAIPLLDHFDRAGVTRRVGNTRYLAGSSGPGSPSEQDPLPG
ncbi:MAG: SelB domain-containing protein, partial [Planctomycetota bacterium]